MNKPLSRTVADAAIAGVALDPTSSHPLHVQLTEQLRQLILLRRIAPGARLPSSRQLAEELGVSRSTIVAAYDQLASEGYSEGRHGSGVYVTAELPDHALQISTVPQKPTPSALPGPQPMRPFQVAAPDLSLFPHEEWARLAWKIWRSPSRALLANPDPRGWAPLRRAIAEYLSAARGLDCAPDQIIVTSGVTESVWLVAHALLRRGDRICVEDPGYPLLLRALKLASLRVTPVRVDEDGLPPARLRGKSTAVAITPSRHYPLGMTMPLQRRLALLNWAEAVKGWIIEDDYDSEFRYRGRPLPALMSLDPSGRTIYLGSFSKVISPAMRLGFLVAPAHTAERFQAAAGELGSRASLMPQPVLAEFMMSGAFASHIRRMRRVYALRQAALIEAAGRHCNGILTISPEAAGMHVVARIADPRLTDTEASHRAAAEGILAPALSSYSVMPDAPQGLVLGYAAFDVDQIRRAICILAGALSAG